MDPTTHAWVNSHEHTQHGYILPQQESSDTNACYANLPVLSVWSGELSRRSEGFSCRTSRIDDFSMARNSGPNRAYDSPEGDALPSARKREDKKKKKKPAPCGCEGADPATCACGHHVRACTDIILPSHLHCPLTLTGPMDKYSTSSC